VAITIGANITALQSQRRLDIATEQLGNVFSKLSSGLRITSAADDAAGISVSDTLRSQGAMARTAQRNASDAISLLSLADGGLNAISDIITRMSELANQFANGTLSDNQRSALSEEFTALKDEWERTASSTNFNSIVILDHEPVQPVTVTFQVGIDNSSNSKISIQTVEATPAALIGYAPLDIIFGGSTIQRLKVAQSTVASMRGSFGAVESRMRSAISNLQISGENFTAAASRIRDIDVAEASANLARLSILQQSSASVLTQANQAPALALSLLG
jgi:flagellin